MRIDEYRKMFESRISAGKNWKIARVGETSRKNCRVVLRHGRTSAKVRWKILWFGQQKDRAITQSSKSSLVMIIISWRRVGNGWRIRTSMLTYRLEMLGFGKKVLPGMFLRDVLFAEVVGKGDIMVADVEELEFFDASEFHARRHNAKEMTKPKNDSKIVWKRPWIPKFHSMAGTTCNEWRPQRIISRKLGEVSTNRWNKRWRWSP